MMAASFDDEPTAITTWQGPAAPLDSILVTTRIVEDAVATSSPILRQSRGALRWGKHYGGIAETRRLRDLEERGIFRGSGVVRSTTGAGVGLPLLVFVVSLLGLLDYCLAGATAATDNTSSSSSSLPSLGRLTLPPSPSRYYNNNNDVTTATTRIGPCNGPCGFINVRTDTTSSSPHDDSAGEPLQLPQQRNTFETFPLWFPSVKDLIPRYNSIVRTRIIGDQLVIIRTFSSASTRPEYTKKRGQSWLSKRTTDETESSAHRLCHPRRGRRRRRQRRRSVDWEGGIRRKRNENEIDRNGVDPLEQVSTISSILWREAATTSRHYDLREAQSEPNESTSIFADVDERIAGVAFTTSKVAIVADRGGAKATKDEGNSKRGTLAGLSETQEENHVKSSEGIRGVGGGLQQRAIGTYGVTSGTRAEPTIYTGKVDSSSKVADSRIVNIHNNNSNIIDSSKNDNLNRERKYNNKGVGGVNGDGRLSVTLGYGAEEELGITGNETTASDDNDNGGSYSDYGSALEWWTTGKVAVPMTARSYPQGEETGVSGRSSARPRTSAVGNSDGDTTGPLERRRPGDIDNATEINIVSEDKDDNESTDTTLTVTTDINASTQLPPPTQDTSMEALSASGYIVSVVLVLLVGALVGVLATVSHHLHHHRRSLTHSGGVGPASILRDHHRHHHRRHHHHNHQHHHSEETPASLQRRLLLQDHRGHPATPMLSVSAGMEVGSGGHGVLGGGLVETGPNGGGGGGVGGVGGVGGSDGMQEAMVAAARDRAIRAGSVRQDLALDLPPRLQLPDGEERPYGAHTTLHLRDPEQESEIYQKCVRPPPNRTVFDSESPPPYRSHSALLDQPDRIVRCHSAGSSLLRVFRKFPSSGGSTPAVVVPPSRRPTLSSYSESSGNLSNLSSLTVVPCETDETNHHGQHV